MTLARRRSRWAIWAARSRATCWQRRRSSPAPTRSAGKRSLAPAFCVRCCPDDLVVWLDLPSRVYHYRGQQRYGAHRAGLTHAGMKRKVRECGPRGQHNELAGSSGPKRASTSCRYFRVVLQQRPTETMAGFAAYRRSEVGLSRPLGRFANRKGPVCRSAADSRPKSDKGLDFPGTQSVHTQGLPRP